MSIDPKIELQKIISVATIPIPSASTSIIGPTITGNEFYEQRICPAPFAWDDDWLVCGEQVSIYAGPVKCVAVQFRRRPARKRYVVDPELIPGRILEDA